MTTAPRPDASVPARPAPVVPPMGALLVAMAATAVTGIVTVVLAAVLAGDAAAEAAMVGAGVALGFFVLGAFFLHFAAGVMPGASLALAMLTYTFQVLALLALFVGATQAGWPATDTARSWFAAAVIAGTVAWTVGHVVAAVRTRQPLYDLPTIPDEKAGA
ncbi:hypothetical protein [Nocardioides massiliensis]|nr:hypothetical protein [Nocardioides massiliensis]